MDNRFKLIKWAELVICCKMPYDELKDCYERAPKPTINIEHTLAIIKPSAMKDADEIIDIILKSGFTIINVRYISVIFWLCALHLVIDW